MDLQHPQVPLSENKTVAEEHSSLSSTPSVTVVVCTRDRTEDLRRCLAAVGKFAYPKFGVLVVNNGAAEEPIRKIAEEFGAQYLRVVEPGLSRARNAAAKASSADVLAYLDDDAVPEPQWLAEIVTEFADPSVMAVTGRADPVSLETDAEQLWHRLNSWIADRSHQWSVGNDSKEWFEKANFGGLGTGCNMAFRRDAWSVWPGFDERLGRGAPIDGSEEHLAFFLLMEKGYRVNYTPNAGVLHPYPATMRAARERYAKDIASGVAYVCLLMTEFPHYRARTRQFIMARFKKTERDWRERPEKPEKVIPSWRVALEVVRGILIYAWTRLTKRRPKYEITSRSNAPTENRVVKTK